MVKSLAIGLTILGKEDIQPALSEMSQKGTDPEHCTLYSLGEDEIMVMKRIDKSYLLMPYSANYDVHTPLFFETNQNYGPRQLLMGKLIDGKLVGSWAYYVGKRKYTTTTGFEKEICVFKEKENSGDTRPRE